jgi:phytoene synthase
MDTWENRLLTLAHAPRENWAGAGETALADPPELNRAYVHSEEITKEHSATFHLASALLPDKQRQAIRALYAFCRVSDDLVDQPQGQGDSATIDEARFERWRQLSLSDNPRKDELVASAWADTRARFNIPRQYAGQLLDGLASDFSVNRYTTFSDLADYCYGAASTVGLMSMHIVGYQDDSAIPYAVKLGVALQLTNILRDVAEDWENGRILSAK